MMQEPNILYYAFFQYYEDATAQAIKYKVTAQAGYYPPMDSLRGRDGKITVYLTEKLKDGLHVPSARLQAKGSLNLTGLKDYYVNGKISGFAYGNPPKGETFGKKQKKNPFYKYDKDGFIFQVYDMGRIIEKNGQRINIPDAFEMIVLSGSKVLAGSYCQSLRNGGFTEELNDLRKQAGIGDRNNNWHLGAKTGNGV